MKHSTKSLFGGLDRRILYTFLAVQVVGGEKHFVRIQDERM